MLSGDAGSLYHHEYPDYGGLLARQREIQQLPSPNLRQQPLQPEQQLKTIPLRSQSQPKIYQHQLHEMNTVRFSYEVAGCRRNAFSF